MDLKFTCDPLKLRFSDSFLDLVTQKSSGARGFCIVNLPNLTGSYGLLIGGGGDNPLCNYTFSLFIF